jgi:hypothetical protein
MRTLAYCCASWRKSVRRAAAVAPVLCPPVTSQAIHPAWLEGYDFLYFKLHGVPEGSAWYGDESAIALTAEQIRQANLTGAVVFAACCHVDNGPMLSALLKAGARAVIAGAGDNYARAETVDGADLLGKTIRILLQIGTDPRIAFRAARAYLKSIPAKSPQVLDALEFAYFPGKEFSP